MKKQLEHIGSKVLIGYVILIIIAILSLSYIYSMMEKVVAAEDVNSIPRQKIYLVTNIQSLLYESETMGQLIEMPEDDYLYFNATLDEARANIEELKLLSADSLFLMKMDTINDLIEQKRQNTADLMQIWREASADLYAKNIKQALEKGTPSVNETAIKESATIKKDTVINTGRRKGFFRRLAEVFVPSDPDSSILVSANQQMQKDTLLKAYNPNEAISQTLRSIQSNVATEKERLRELLVGRSASLRYDNSIITAKINQILREMEEEEMEASLVRLQERQDLLNTTSYLITVIGVLSLLVALFFLFFIGRDISKSRYFRKQLEKEKQYTEDLLNSREKLILTIGHDIRAPLSSIIGYIELLQRSFPDDKQRLFLSNMSSSSSHILTLVNDLLDFQRLDSGQMEVHEIPFRIENLFNEIYDSFKPQAESKGLELKKTLADTPALVYQGDSVRIRQIVGNLLSNAIKFTNEGTVEMIIDGGSLSTGEPLVEDGAEGAEPQLPPSVLTVTVRDTGDGIPVEQQERIFNEFTRLEGAEKTEGFGLGLSITHKLVTLLGGSISLKSEVGEGSDFIITIPLTLAENQQLPEDDKVADEPVDMQSFRDRSVTCLIVDDDLLQIVLMEEVLKQLHLNVISCTNPRLVLNMLKEKPVDVLITDIQMPGMDGYDLIRQVRGSDLPNAQSLPVIVLSATVGQDRQRYKEAGFTDALSKPFTAEQLAALLNQILPKEVGTQKAPDFSPLTAFAGEDKQASDNILRTFSEETTKHIEQLKLALQTGDRDLSARITHKLVPLFTMLEAKILVQQLRILERNDIELTDSGWKHLLEDAIGQIESILLYANNEIG